MNILITGVGGPSPRSFAIALKQFSTYTNYNLIGTDINPLAVGLYRKDLFNKTCLIPKATDAGYWQAIENIVANERIDLAVILPELEVLEWSKRQQKDKLPCKSLIPDHSVTELLVDKAKMTALLEAEGLVPKSVAFASHETDFSHLFTELGNPFWVRGTVGTSGLGSLKIESEEALKNWLQINPGVKAYLASTYLPGRNLACKMLYYEGELLRVACAERVNYIMAKVAPSGITGNTSFGRLLNEPLVVQVAKKAMDKIFTSAGVPKHGFFTVDFKENEQGEPLITEINVRHVAFTQCFAAGGANFAEDTIRLLDNDPTFDKSYKMYAFEKDLIFLRDVDVEPILMKETELLRPPNPDNSGEGGFRPPKF